MNRIDNAGPSNRVLYESGLTETSFTSGLMEAGTYRFWVRAINSAGRAGIWSAPLDFQISDLENSQDGTQETRLLTQLTNPVATPAAKEATINGTTRDRASARFSRDRDDAIVFKGRPGLERSADYEAVDVSTNLQNTSNPDSGRFNDVDRLTDLAFSEWPGLTS
ncbi:MAG: fibronectin type III domain-containing protein [Planctomycetaceae bacterium]